jgi:hypothetical protein
MALEIDSKTEELSWLLAACPNKLSNRMHSNVFMLIDFGIGAHDDYFLIVDMQSYLITANKVLSIIHEKPLPS